MADAMAGELRALQIPFFYRNGRPAGHDPAGSHRTKDASAALSGEELAGLQRRMLELLQDLCKE